ncbi:hypothetical protein H0R94_09685 [Treponema socranskii]|uniref:DUF5986 family protein n=1 Tax=Treponema socranskii TaxID=53419 RepID=UPI003D89FC2E
MSQILFQYVFEALSEVAEDYQFQVSQFPTATHNARAGARWDIINTNLIKKFENKSIEAVIVKRGFWEMAILLSREENCIYTLMRKNRLKDIISDPGRKVPKYVQALTTLNADLGLANSELFEFQTDKSELHFVLDNLCKSLNSASLEQKPHYKIITFDTDYDFRIVDFELNVLDYTCHKLREENIMDSIKPIYSNEIQQVDDNTEKMPKLKLRKKAEDRITNLNSGELKDMEQLHSHEA